MANEEVLGPRKTMFVLVIVVGCFAVLWPRILSPLILGNARDQLQPNQFDREAGCCEVIFETEVAVLELVNEVCGLAVGANGKLSPYAAAECRKAVNDTCGVDIAAFLKRNENVGITTKKLLELMKNSNSSCLKEHFGVPVWSLSTHPALNSWTLQDTLKQERPPIRGIAPHPALLERGRAIPAGAPTPPSRGPVPLPPHARVRSSPLSVYFELDIKPPPIPGMRPPLGSPGGPVPAPKSSMGFVMPIYTICIIVFFVYTLSKILFKRTSTVPYDTVIPDPQFRRRVFRDDSRSSPDPKLVVTAISGLVAEVQQQMEASYGHNQQRQDVQDNHTRPYSNGTVLSDSTPIRIIASEFKDQSKETSPEPQQGKEYSPGRKEYVQEPTERIPETIDYEIELEVPPKIGYLEEMPIHEELMSQIREVTPEREVVLRESDPDLISAEKSNTSYVDEVLESRELTSEQITTTPELSEPAQKDTIAEVNGVYKLDQAKQIIDSEKPELTEITTSLDESEFETINDHQETFPSDVDVIQVQTDSNYINKQTLESREDAPVIQEATVEEPVILDLDLREIVPSEIEGILEPRQLESEVGEVASILKEDTVQKLVPECMELDQEPKITVLDNIDNILEAEKLIQEPETKLEISHPASNEVTLKSLNLEFEEVIQKPDNKVEVSEPVSKELRPEPLQLESKELTQESETKAEVSKPVHEEFLPEPLKLEPEQLADPTTKVEISEPAQQLMQSTPESLQLHEQNLKEITPAKTLQTPVDLLLSEYEEQKVKLEEETLETEDLLGQPVETHELPIKCTPEPGDEVNSDLLVKIKPTSLSLEKSDFITEDSNQNNFEADSNNTINDTVIGKLIEKMEGDKVEEVVKSTEDFLNEARIVSTEELKNRKLSTLELLKEALEEEKESDKSISETPEPENATVKVVGMELTAHSADGGIWPRAEPPPVTPVPPQRPPHEAEEVKSIFLETEIPQKSRVLVADFEDRPESPQPSKHSPLVVSGKMTLSLIQDAPRDTPDREPESTVDEFTTVSAATEAAAEKDEEFSEEEIEEEIEIEEIEEEEEEEEMPDIQEAIHQIKKTDTGNK